jgi:hypothetical protein
VELEPGADRASRVSETQTETQTETETETGAVAGGGLRPLPHSAGLGEGGGSGRGGVNHGPGERLTNSPCLTREDNDGEQDDERGGVTVAALSLTVLSRREDDGGLLEEGPGQNREQGQEQDPRMNRSAQRDRTGVRTPSAMLPPDYEDAAAAIVRETPGQPRPGSSW